MIVRKVYMYLHLKVAADTKNYMRGVTGKIRLNNSGMRSMDLKIVELGKNLTKVTTGD